MRVHAPGTRDRPGERLPVERELITLLGVSRLTAREAVAAGEPDQAEKIAREHFTISADMIRDVLARVGNAGQS